MLANSQSGFLVPVNRLHTGYEVLITALYKGSVCRLKRALQE
jgi:hypothetical protein